ncbi:MAG: PEP-CTERM sorting domain-containing protein [candidate division Zixibacteria bacterium]|nr:PEP-CTERM sorting domain-containing protein [candidate division Zixibacteria bacterium]
MGRELRVVHAAPLLEPEDHIIPVNQIGLFGLSTGGTGLSIGGTGLSIVPEPGTLILLGTGVLGLLCYAWRQRKRAA